MVVGYQIKDKVTHDDLISMGFEYDDLFVEYEYETDEGTIFIDAVEKTLRFFNFEKDVLHCYNYQLDKHDIVKKMFNEDLLREHRFYKEDYE